MAQLRYIYCFIYYASYSTTFPLHMAIVAAIAATSTRIQCESRNRVKASLGSRSVWKGRLVFLPVVNPLQEKGPPIPILSPFNWDLWFRYWYRYKKYTTYIYIDNVYIYIRMIINDISTSQGRKRTRVSGIVQGVQWHIFGTRINLLS